MGGGANAVVYDESNGSRGQHDCRRRGVGFDRAGSGPGNATQPDFSSHEVGWIGLNGGGPFFEPVPGRLPPPAQDPAYPFIPNGVGKQPTFRIADLSNPEF